MPKLKYWEEGPFGPFEVQEDGWPNAGQVMRYFRERSDMTAKAFGQLYGKEIREDEKPVSERWILEMELENKVPTDITRRRVIARLLNIPPLLLGLASLEDIVIQPHQVHSMLPTIVNEGTLKRVYLDISKYEKNIRMALALHQTSNAQNLLHDISSGIKELEQFESQTRGNLLYRIRELLISHDLLAAKIERDRRQYAFAYAYASHAVRLAKRMKDNDLIATTKYTRGCIKLQWGQFDVMKKGSFQIERRKVEDAIRDFQAILNGESSPGADIHPQLKGFTLLQLSRAQSLLTSTYGHNPNHVDTLILADRAAYMVERDDIDELYIRMLVTGTLSGLHLGGYHLIRADIFNTVGLANKAFIELSQFNKLIERTYGQDETRNQAWSEIVLAKTLIGLKEYSEAASRAKAALVKCHTIHSIQNIVIIADIYSRLASDASRSSRDLKELRDMLQEWYDLVYDELKQSR